MAAGQRIPQTEIAAARALHFDLIDLRSQPFEAEPGGLCRRRLRSARGTHACRVELPRTNEDERGPEEDHRLTPLVELDCPERFGCRLSRL